MDAENITNETRLTRIQALVVEVLNDLLRSPIEGTDDAIHRAIGRIGAYCRRDRSYVFVLREGLGYNTHEWCAAGIEPAIDQLQGLPKEVYGSVIEPLEAGQPYHVPDVSLLPPESDARALFEMQAIRSVLLVPMRAEGATYGFIGFDGVTNTHAFLPGEMYLLQSVADVICTVLTRREADRAVNAAQAALAEERAFLKTILQTSAMGIVVLDDDGVIGYANAAAEVVLGLPHSVLIGARHDNRAWLVTKEDGETHFAPGEWPYDQVLATGQPVTDVRFALHCPEGLRFVSIHAAPTEAGMSRAARVVYAMVDVTAQVRAERAKAEALDEARRANMAKSNFLAKMSHEMRTPLNGVLGIAELLERLVTDPEHRRMVKVMHESGTLLLGIINDLLDMSKIEAEQLEIEVLAFSVSEIAQRIEAVHTLKAAEKQMSFAVQVQGDGDAARMGDPYRLLQILHNLISNAIKFTPQGSVVVQIDVRDPAALRLVVTDTGIGMTEAEMKTLFEEFGQADSSIARRFGGTGLGMPIVKRLVGLMGGQVGLVSEPGRGTRVQVDLPFALADEVAAAPAPSPAPAPADLSGLRVLAADDNRTNRMILNAMLWQLGISAVMVADGGAALKAFGAERFDVVILDISMPDLDGITVMRRIRQQVAAEAGRAMPRILAFTANAMSHQIEAYLQAGFDACLTKPLQLVHLSAALAPTGPPAPLRADRAGQTRRRA